MKFLVIDGELLKNTSLTPTDKFIVSYLYNLQKAGSKYWGSPQYLASEFGIGVDYIEKRFKFLTEKGIIKKMEDGWTLNLPIFHIFNFKG